MTIYHLLHEQSTLDFGKKLSSCLLPSTIIFLEGELGAGKTTLTRGILQGLGYRGKVKSPTYTLVEIYPLNHITLYHYDFYRLNYDFEFNELALQDHLHEAGFFIIEWAQKGVAHLPHPDLKCYISIYDESRKLEIIANSKKGETLLAQLTT